MAGLLSYLVDTTALVVPVDRDSVLYPGHPLYEGLLDEVRSDRVHVFGLVRSYGLLPEGQIKPGHAFLNVFWRMPHRRTDNETVRRIRAWLLERGSKYKRIVYVRRRAKEPESKLWATALRGGRNGSVLDPAILHRIRVIRIPDGRVRDHAFRKTLRGACRVRA